MNDPIAEAREVALSFLKPSQRDLEYGLALHREAVVAESYSLGLHAPRDAAFLNGLIAEGAGEVEFRDWTEEMGMTGWTRTEALRAEYAAAWEASGVDCMFLNAGEEGNDPLRLLKRLSRYHYLTEALPETVGLVRRVEDVVALKAAGRRGICLAPNGVPLAGGFVNPQDEIRYIRVFAQLGARMMHLTYNRRNPMGDGCAEPANAGLSDFGHLVVREMNRLGIIIDIAHTGWQTSLDTARVSSVPVVVSHSAVWALQPHVRCKSDEVIRAVVERGGTMGITNVPAFLGGGGTIVEFLDHIDYVAKRFGEDAVTIGTDCGHRSVGAKAEDAKINPRDGLRRRWENFWPENDAVHAPEWAQPHQMKSMAWTNWPLFTVGLVQRGYSDEAIRKIIGGNILRVAGEVWCAGRPA